MLKRLQRLKMLLNTLKNIKTNYAIGWTAEIKKSQRVSRLGMNYIEVCIRLDVMRCKSLYDLTVSKSYLILFSCIFLRAMVIYFDAVHRIEIGG